MRRRRLTPEEVELWRKVAERTERLAPAAHEMDAAPPVPTPAPRKVADTTVRTPPAKARKTSHDLTPALPDRIRQTPVRMNYKTFGRLRRGKLRPEGRIDLHGMTLDRAHPALTRFILAAHGQGKRLVLVITGKGKQRDTGGPIPVRHGVLRHQVPQWLKLPPLSAVVLQVTQAHISHGGEGAYYVYLSRNR